VIERREGDEIVRLHIATLIGRFHPLHPLLFLASISPNYVGTFCNRLQEAADEGTVRDFAGRTGEHVGKVTEKGCRGSHRGRYLNGAKFVTDPFRFWATCGNQTLVGLRVRKEAGGMKALQIELPPEVSEEETRLLLAIKLYELGRLSLGQSAELADYSKRAFIELLGKYGIPAVAYLPEALREEVNG